MSTIYDFPTVGFDVDVNVNEQTYDFIFTGIPISDIEKFLEWVGTDDGKKVIGIATVKSFVGKGVLSAIEGIKAIVGGERNDATD